MIKFFKTQDVLVTRFTVSKEKTFNNVLNNLLFAVILQYAVQVNAHNDKFSPYIRGLQSFLFLFLF